MVEKWDVHTHTVPSPDTFESLARFAHYARFVHVRARAGNPCCAEMVDGGGRLFRLIEDNAYDGEARIADCERHGVTMQVVSPTPVMIPDCVPDETDAAEICKIINDGNAGMVDGHPGRFTALGAIPMRFPDAAILEMQRIKAMGMRGIEINSNIDGLDLDDPRFYSVFEAAAALDMAIFIHPWGGFMEPSEDPLARRMNTNRDWLPWLAGMPLETALAFNAMCRGGIHERLPRLRVLYAHGGGAFPALLGRLEHGVYSRPDLFRNRTPSNLYDTVQSCGIYTDSLTHSPFAFQMLFNLMGAGRIAMGSDYPYPLGETDPFDGRLLENPHGHARSYSTGKAIYPGHMIEHLPGPDTDIAESWKNFPWITGTTPDNAPRDLPRLTEAQRLRMLAGTAKEWLGHTE